MQLIRPVDWSSETRFVVDGLEFHGDLTSFREMTTRDRVVILKDSRLLRQYLDFLAPHVISNLFEFGIWQGGSPIFYGLATDVKKVVAVDFINRNTAPDLTGQDPILKLAYRNPAIDAIVRDRGLSDRVKLNFGVSQDNRQAVSEILDREFGDEPLDLVIDDASHHYDYSRKSFEIVFPRLREGGLYIIEDWQWAHMDSASHQSGETFGDKPALTNFIFELLIAYGSHPDLFWNIVVRDWFIALQKGSKRLDADFRLDDVLRMRGKRLTLI
ncbi:MAG TPA: class I SAM-dependent methyltransferase [Stellaceae bacterium]|nr:class I SAM-dependent methyltransferase [Stellaceae bacterium]